MPFSRAVELFNYWSASPPVHLLLRAFMGYEGATTGNGSAVNAPPNPLEQAEAMRILSGGQPATKLANAPQEDRARFETLKRMSLERKSA